MGDGFVAGVFVLAIAVAIRSTWSPCGLSMLSTVTPLAERGRAHRYGVTASWFILGGIAGGATLGLGTALVAWLVAAADPAPAVIGAVVVLAAMIAIASDTNWLGFRLPAHTRQVDDAWLARYRAWVYGIGFGWQIGIGLATYIMTAGVYLLIVGSALAASPFLAFAIGVVFGAVRGLAVLLSARISTPAGLFAFHRRFETIGPYARTLVVTVQLTFALGVAAGTWGVVGVFAVMFALAIGGITARVARSGRLARTSLQPS
ncbi:MAG: hypothetical protein ACT4OX_03145 [Actinomycetota bacterium]